MRAFYCQRVKSHLHTTNLPVKEDEDEKKKKKGQVVPCDDQILLEQSF